MSNYNLRLDLSKLEGFGEMTLTGNSGIPTECIVIPKKKNNIFTSEKTGARYIDLVCFETPNSDYGTHMVTLSKTQEEQEKEKQTGERIRKPILGNLKEFGQTQKTQVETYSRPASSSKPIAPTPTQDEGDGLPF